MDKEHVKGAMDEVKGKTKEVAGHVLGNKKLEAEGEANEAEGAAHKAVGDVKDKAKGAVNNASRKR